MMKELLIVLSIIAIVLSIIAIWLHGACVGYGNGREALYKEAISKGAGTYVVDNNKTISFKWNCEK